MLRFPVAKIENDQRPGAKTGVRRFDPAAFLATTAKGRAVSTHRKGKVLFAQGDASDAVFYLKKGKVKLTVLSKQGKEAVVALLSADDTAPLEMEGPMRVTIAFVIAAVALGYVAKSTVLPASRVTGLLTTIAPAATTISPHEIHLNYKAMKELPVHDSTNAN
jgi:CRP-like cAMP-binding protein